ncbi:cytochrome P450 [Tateyamaria omphalii]|uniref:cytochrome P450 n=1 Tax=Tateyamaria omphalii TaxID=299262 RepID=UPI001C99D5F9|nr:cytochrome P450 [Tateyamaria omphalii]MBY5932833.1 cytochrome P450 [Tateyamaria omphalii]
MSSAPTIHIDPATFHADPYPTLAAMRQDAPVCYVPELGATLFTRRDDVFREEKRVDLFSSHQPNGLLTKVMGSNLMRKDGDAHMRERKALFPALSPRTVRDVLGPKFREIVQGHIDRLKPLGACDLVTDYAMPVSADALRLMTGLTNMEAAEMDAASQAMLDAAANYQRDPEVDRLGYGYADRVLELIKERLPQLRAAPDMSIISVLDQAGLTLDEIAGNVRVIIGGGQNEPRDAIAGTVWALLSHPDQYTMIKDGSASWNAAFDEYVRLVAPIGMSPRRVARNDTACGVDFEADELIFLMFGSACRDADHFDRPDTFDLTRDTGPAIPFGAGPHFCAGAAASRTLIAGHALPMLFDQLPNLRLTDEVTFAGWAFRGPLSVPVTWDN